MCAIERNKYPCSKSVSHCSANMPSYSKTELQCGHMRLNHSADLPICSDVTSQLSYWVAMSICIV